MKIMKLILILNYKINKKIVKIVLKQKINKIP